mgnify:FL=1|tara:strand:- start:1425 stop:1997 length:573 start_codon:yes stop_codon:yes gene_type:complete
MIANCLIIILLAHSSGGHSGGGHSSGGHSSGGHSSGEHSINEYSTSGHSVNSNHGMVNNVPHLIATNVISQYLVWSYFVDGIKFNFESKKQYEIYTLKVYNYETGCLYFMVNKNPINITEIDGRIMILTTNSTIIESKMGNYINNKICKKFINETLEASLIKIFAIIIILLFLSIICCEPREYNYSNTMV